ncbi:hypothetical protein DFJ77DRAFT_473245 [Powellomyces hirtus]|nr:hypothetical protein DFJ77DRAFT_473245 [Powellomyces hirtus]
MSLSGDTTVVLPKEEKKKSVVVQVKKSVPSPPIPATQIPGHVLRVGIRAGLLGFALRAGVAFLIRLVGVARGKTSLRDALIRTLTAKAMRQFAYFLGSFAAIWKGVNSVLRLVRNGTDDKLNGFIAGACAGLALGFEDKERRISIAQQMLVRGLRGVFHGMKTRNIFHLPHGESLVFALASAQIMYAYALHPTTIPKAFYTFIRKTGPLSEPVLNFVRANVRNLPFDPEAGVAVVQKLGGTSHAVATVANLGHAPAIIPCEILHPWTDSCSTNGAMIFMKVFKKIIPVYASLMVVPMVLLKMKDVIRRPVPLLRHALFNATRSSVFLSVFVAGYQQLACRYRDLISHTILSRDSKLAYWFFGFFASASIFIEQRKRRTELAMYVLPRGIDSFYKILRNRDLAPRIKYFEIFMFSMGMGIIISFFQTEPEAISGLLYKALRRFNIAIEDKREGDTDPGDQSGVAKKQQQQQH